MLKFVVVGVVGGASHELVGEHGKAVPVRKFRTGTAPGGGLLYEHCMSTVIQGGVVDCHREWWCVGGRRPAGRR